MPEPASGPGWTLAIETSSRRPSIAVARDGEPPREMALDGDVARWLVPEIDALARAVGLAPAGLRRIVLGVGPGSFTGLRIGAAAARTLAAVSGASLAAHASTLALAEAARGARRAAVALDALRGDFAIGEYDVTGPFPRELREPRLVPGTDATRVIADADAIVIADEAGRFRFSGAKATVVHAVARASVLLALDRAGAPPRASATPIYLRASAAEERASGG